MHVSDLFAKHADFVFGNKLNIYKIILCVCVVPLHTSVNALTWKTILNTRLQIKRQLWVCLLFLLIFTLIWAFLGFAYYNDRFLTNFCLLWRALGNAVPCDLYVMWNLSRCPVTLLRAHFMPPRRIRIIMLTLLAFFVFVTERIPASTYPHTVADFLSHFCSFLSPTPWQHLRGRLSLPCLWPVSTSAGISFSVCDDKLMWRCFSAFSADLFM